MNRYLSMGLAVLAASVLACGGKDSGGGGGGAPTLTLVGFGEPPQGIVLGTTAPQGDWNVFQLDYRVPGGSWLEVTRALAASETGIVLLSDVGLDGQTFEFRLRCWAGRTASQWSEVLSVTVPVRGAADLTAETMGGPSPWMYVGWRKVSRSAEVVPRLERRAVSPGDVAGPWGTVAVDPLTTGWAGTEPLYADGNAVEYRVTYVLGALESEPVTVRTTWSAPGPVNGFHATVEGQTVHLTWSAPDGYAYTYELVRQSATAQTPVDEPLPAPAPGATSLDLANEPPGQWRYGISVRVTPASDLSARVYTDALVAREGMQTTRFLAPAAARAARDAAGHLALARSVGCASPSGPSVFFPLEPARGTFQKTGGRLLAPGVIFSGGAAHAIHEQDCVLTHLWNDGSWHEEAIGVPGCPMQVGSSDFSVDPSGALHLLLGALEGYLHVSNAGGAWAVEDVVPSSSGFPITGLAFTPGGEPGLLTQQGIGQARSLLRRGSGGWTAVAYPYDGTTSWYPFSLVLPTSDTALSLVEYGYGYGRTYTVKRNALAWEDPVAIKGVGLGQAAATRDGKRIVVPLGGDVLGLAIRDDGVWSTTPLLNGAGRVDAGLDESGKWWLVDGLDAACDRANDDTAAVPYLLFAEP
ncbi:MAG: hypothetical protein QM767_28760 [Anaeromyxobacter sp.]